MMNTNIEEKVSGNISTIYAQLNESISDNEIPGDWIKSYLNIIGNISTLPDYLDNKSFINRPQDFLRNKNTVFFVKELFNYYFRDLVGDLYQNPEYLILSSGTASEDYFGLPHALKKCIEVALQKNWYGYSSSCGRSASRVAIADFENQAISSDSYNESNVAITMGGTAAISSLVDFLSFRGYCSGEAICAIPNYPPLVAATAMRMSVRLVPTSSGPYYTDISNVINSITKETSLVILQSVTNPTGLRVEESQLIELIRKCNPDTVIILDECHDCYPYGDGSSMPKKYLANNNVVRVKSFSKAFGAPGLKIGWILADKALVDEFYEYASTMYGSPPSIFYLLIEMSLRMEMWRLAGSEDIQQSEINLFDTEYKRIFVDIKKLYEEYVIERNYQEKSIIKYRSFSVNQLQEAGWETISPKHSINILATHDGVINDFTEFQLLLKHQKIVAYPGILSMVLDSRWLRFSPLIGDEYMKDSNLRLQNYMDLHR